MTIIVDTREQLPLWIDNIQKRKLEVGDYSTVKLENKFHIERKSPQDLYGSIIQGHVRFRKMLVRAKVNNIRIVVFVESGKNFFLEKKFPQGYKRKLPTETLTKILSTICLRHSLEVVWCKDREALVKKVVARLKLEESKLKQRELGAIVDIKYTGLR